MLGTIAALSQVLLDGPSVLPGLAVRILQEARSESRRHGTPGPCDAPAMTLRASICGPATTKTQTVVGAVVAFALALLVGLGLKQGTDSSVFTALLIGLAVLMIGLKRSDTARN